MAAGTAIYDALAAKTEKINRSLTSEVINPLRIATAQPLMIGINAAKAMGNHPNSKKDFIFRPLLIPISNKKMAKKPLNKSLVNGLIPSACFASAR